MDPAESQDFAHSIRARMHFALIVFRDGIVRIVELVRLLDGPRGDEAALIVGLDQDRIAVYRLLARQFPRPEEIDEPRWQELYDLWLEALTTWRRVGDKKTPPRKRERARRVLKNNPLAGYALVCLMTKEDGK